MVYVFLANGFEDIEAIASIDILRRAGVEVTTVSITDNISVVSSHGVPMIADVLFKNCFFESVKAIVFPGGLGNAEALSVHLGVKDLLFKYKDTNTYLAAICASPMAFGKYGLVDGKKATIYPGMQEKLGNAKYIDNELVVVDGNMVTAKGPAASIPFAFKLAELLKGKEVVAEVKKAMCFE